MSGARQVARLRPGDELELEGERWRYIGHAKRSRLRFRRGEGEREVAAAWIAEQLDYQQRDARGVGGA
jgi:hypothetical protein